MAMPYVQIAIPAQVHDRLHARRARLVLDLHRGDHGLGVGSTIGMLLDHWEAHPPDQFWIEENGRGYPSPGRPRKSEKAARIYRGGKHDVWRGHQFKSPAANPHAHFCTVCDGWWNQATDPEGVASPCPAVETSRMFKLRKRTREELLKLTFTADEVNAILQATTYGETSEANLEHPDQGPSGPTGDPGPRAG